MSKSAENDNSRINLTDTAADIRRKIKRCKTDEYKGLEFDNSERPECNNLLNIYMAVTNRTKDEIAVEVKEMSWGDFKPILAEAVVTHLEPIQLKYNELMKDEAYLDSVLLEGQMAAGKFRGRGVIELWGLLIYIGPVLFHVEWFLRQLALMFFYHIL